MFNDCEPRETIREAISLLDDLGESAYEFILVVMTPEERRCIAVVQSLGTFVDIAEETVKCYEHFEGRVKRNEADSAVGQDDIG